MYWLIRFQRYCPPLQGTHRLDKRAAVEQRTPRQAQVEQAASLHKENLRLTGRGGHAALHSRACSRQRLRALGFPSPAHTLANRARFRAPIPDGSLERSPARRSENLQRAVRPPSPPGPRAACFPGPARGFARVSLGLRLPSSRGAHWASGALDPRRRWQ